MEPDHAVVQRLLGVIVKAAQSTQTTDLEYAGLLDEASALLWYMKPDVAPLPLTTLKRYIMHFPLEHWLNEEARAGFTGMLQTGGAASLLCDEILMELDPAKGWEQVQAIMLQIRDLCRNREQGEQEYPVIRRFMVEHGMADIDQSLDFLVPIGVGFTALFEPIPLHSQLDGQIYLCPSCGWPMRLDQQHVRCGAQWCWHHVGSFEWRDAGLVSARSTRVVEPRSVDNNYRLKTGLWKFTLVPGLLELNLLQRLTKLGLQPTLWPGVDKADIRFVVGSEEIEIDAKVWASSTLLCDHLANLPARPLWIVIPDYQASHLQSLREACPKHVIVMTQTQCIRKASKLCQR
ncbi:MULTISPECIES: hypothetical protein [Pseudomonas]|uniref:restriction endonuclease-related protein n=1 Tax=Pseudomonas TaxID=286 RepID=UPI0025808A88|nr:MULTISPECIES: hypothetical protein [Pseudomonas]